MYLHTTDRAVRLANAAEFGALIRARRKKLGYTQEDIAAMMGCSARLVGDIERGKQTVGIQRVLDLALGLGMDLYGIPRGE